MSEVDSGSTRNKLRVGLLIDHFEQPRWIQSALEQVEQWGGAEIVLFVRDASPPGHRVGRLKTYFRNRRVLAHAAYERLDGRRFAIVGDPFEPVDIRPTYPNVPVLDVCPRRTKHSDYFDAADVAAIRAYDLDVAVRFGFRILRGDILDIARHGVWSYHHGDNNVNRGGPAGFWEVMEDTPITGSILQVLTEDLDGGTVLYRSYASTNRFSVRKNRHNYFWKSSAFLCRALRALHDDGTITGTGDSPVSAYGHRLYTVPENATMARLAARLAGRFAAFKLQQQTQLNQWCLAYRRTPETHRGETPDLAAFRFKTLTPPPDRFWADPFPVRHGDGHVVLFEEYEYAQRRGHISAIEIDSRGHAGTPVRVLERPYHLSYPFVFDWRGERFLIPESAEHGTVDLFRAKRFPDEWEHVATLIDGEQLYDATLAEIDGRWWMFAGSSVAGASSWDELSVYYSDSPLGPWKPHRRNPIVSDVRTARPAGRLFRANGVWYRPSQDCSRSYGYAVQINQITRLDPQGYSEVPVTRLTPNWRPDVSGVHTVNSAPGLTVVDARIRRWRLFAGQD